MRSDALAPAAPRSRVGRRVAVPQPGAERRTEAKSSVTAETMLRVALNLFARQDFSTVTIKDIAKQTGFNPSLLYYYFENKEELFRRAIDLSVETAFEKFEAIRAAPETPESVISSWIEIHIIQFVLMQKLAKVSLDYASTRTRTREMDGAIRQFYDKEAVVLGHAIREGVEQGLFRPTKPKEMAVFISTFLDGALFRNMMFPDFNYKAAIRHMRRVVLHQLRGGTAGASGVPATTSARVRRRKGGG
jgi:AcrR family transcriptional regulator